MTPRRRVFVLEADDRYAKRCPRCGARRGDLCIDLRNPERVRMTYPRVHVERVGRVLGRTVGA
jgi:hypothetical protein